MGCKNCDRRSFLKLGGMTLVLSAVNPSFLRAANDPRLERYRNLGSMAAGKTFIHIWQRGGKDGLNAVIPTEAGEYSIYQGYRPNLQIAMPDLTGQQLTPDFALHPVTRDAGTGDGLYKLWQQGRVAVLPTVGYPDSSRSHFDGQKFIEVGIPGNKTSPDGWLNRYLQTTAGSGDPLRAISFTNGIPFQMVGPAPVLSFTDLEDLSVSRDATRNQKYLDIMRDVHDPASQPGRTWDREIADSGRGLVEAIQAIEAIKPLPPPNVPYPGGSFGDRMMRLAQLMRSGQFQIELVNIEIGGWDTHTQQGSTTGAMPGLLQQVSQAIYAFVADLDAEDPILMDDVVLATISEFGRTARENGNQGTDHGNASASFIVGNSVNQGVYMGSAGWPGLTTLRDNRDLLHTVDFRDLYAEVLDRHLGALDPGVFPGWTYTPLGFL